MSVAPQAARADGLAYLHAEPPPFGEPVEVAPGVLWLRMPLPYRLDHINLWLIEDGDGWVAVDCGLATAAARELWQGVLARWPVRRIVVTHFHPDHMGLAGWLCADHEISALTSRDTWMAGQLAWGNAERELSEDRLAFYRAHGATEPMLEGLAELFLSYGRTVSPIPPRFDRLDDGDELMLGGRSWRILLCEGHAPGHVCLHCPSLGVLISGDQVLPRITTNIAVWDTEPEADPLGEFLDSLARLRSLPGDTLVLPSHGLVFRGLAARIDALCDHHVERLEETIAACAEERDATSLISVLFRDGLDSLQSALALGESVAHLNHLQRSRRLTRINQPDASIVFRKAD